MNDNDVKYILEALLMSSGTPLSTSQLLSVFDFDQPVSSQQIQNALAELEKDYSDRAIELKKVASGYQLQTREKYAPWIVRLQAEKPGRYSRALLEVLAIIAYRQPVTRADIESIRGVAVSTSMLKTLLEREWIRSAGCRDVPGKPAVYVTTRQFLDYFNLENLTQLPPLAPIKEILEENTSL